MGTFDLVVCKVILGSFGAVAIFKSGSRNAADTDRFPFHPNVSYMFCGTVHTNVTFWNFEI